MIYTQVEWRRQGRGGAERSVAYNSVAEAEASAAAIRRMGYLAWVVCSTCGDGELCPANR